MSRQAEALKLAEELLSDIELSRLDSDKCLLKGTRLARLVADEDAQDWLHFELHGYDASSPRWRELMEMTGRWVDESKEKAFSSSLPSLQGLLEAEKGRLAALQTTSLSGDYIVIAQNNRFAQVNGASQSIAEIARVIAGVMAALHDFAARTYYELSFSEIQAELFASMQSEVDARVAPAVGDALSKIEAINERLQTNNAEATSHAMSTCRRLIDATADALCLPAHEVVEIDGQQVSIGQSNVLNRLNYYAFKSGASKGRRDRIRRTLSDIYGRVSKGVHEDVTPMEARFIFLQTYLTLGELITLEQP
jgi:sulfur transfer complex TusBCD TusB component (DsrH family)